MDMRLNNLVNHNFSLNKTYKHKRSLNMDNALNITVNITSRK